MKRIISFLQTKKKTTINEIEGWTCELIQGKPPKHYILLKKVVEKDYQMIADLTPLQIRHLEKLFSISKEWKFQGVHRIPERFSLVGEELFLVEYIAPTEEKIFIHKYIDPEFLKVYNQLQAV